MDGSSTIGEHQLEANPGQERGAAPWLFSRRIDLWTFGGSTLLSLALLAVAWVGGWIDAPLPLWLWVGAVLGVDVAHVHATWFRVYLEPEELQRRRLLYFGIPLLGYLAGVAIHHASSLWFWRLLAYAAVFHFVRQPYGWVALYRAKGRDPNGWERILDTAAIYIATIWPLLWWHGHLPRAFAWFVPDDFAGPIPAAIASATAPLYAGILSLFAAVQLFRWGSGRTVNAGKALVVATTTLTWYVGIVWLDSDVAFTVTNVLPHGLPYIVLVWHVIRRHPRPTRPGLTARVWLEGPLAMIAVLLLVAFAEELAWDATVWHERPMLFGGGINVGDWQSWLVPLLALPQLTHYVLDGFIWRRRSNPELKRQLEPGTDSSMWNATSEAGRIA